MSATAHWVAGFHEEGARCDEVPELHNFWMAHTDFHTSGLVIAISITQGRLAEAAVMLEPGALFDSATRVLAQAVSRSGERTGVGDAPVSSPEALRLIH